MTDSVMTALLAPLLGMKERLRGRVAVVRTDVAGLRIASVRLADACTMVRARLATGERMAAALEGLDLDRELGVLIVTAEEITMRVVLWTGSVVPTGGES